MIIYPKFLKIPFTFISKLINPKTKTNSLVSPLVPQVTLLSDNGPLANEVVPLVSDNGPLVTMQNYINNSKFITNQEFIRIIYNEMMISFYGELTFEDENLEKLPVTTTLCNYLIQNDKRFNKLLLSKMYTQRKEIQKIFQKHHHSRQKYLKFIQDKQIINEGTLSITKGPLSLTPFDNYDPDKWIIHFDTNYLKTYPKYKEEFDIYTETVHFYNSFSEHINSYLLLLNKIFITQDFLKEIEKNEATLPTKGSQVALLSDTKGTFGNGPFPSGNLWLVPQVALLATEGNQGTLPEQLPKAPLRLPTVPTELSLPGTFV